jgi:hypothetical protein
MEYRFLAQQRIGTGIDVLLALLSISVLTFFVSLILYVRSGNTVEPWRKLAMAAGLHAAVSLVMLLSVSIVNTQSADFSEKTAAGIQSAVFGAVAASAFGLLGGFVFWWRERLSP